MKRDVYEHRRHSIIAAIDSTSINHASGVLPIAPYCPARSEAMKHQAPKMKITPVAKKGHILLELAPASLKMAPPMPNSATEMVI